MFRFQEHINSNSLDEVLSSEELLKLKAEAGAAPPGFSVDNEPGLAAPAPGNKFIMCTYCCNLFGMQNLAYK